MHRLVLTPQFASLLSMATSLPGTVEAPENPAALLSTPIDCFCSCGRRGCRDVFPSCRAALRHYRQGPAEGPRHHELLLTSEDRSLRAAAALEKQAKQIGRGLGLRIAGFAPGMILIAGEIAGAWSRFGPVIDREAAGFRVAGAPPRILPAHEGEIARLPGAAAPSSSAIARSRRQRGPSRRAAEKALRSSPNADPQTFSTQMRPSRELASRVVSPHPLKQRSKSIRLP